MKCGTGANSEDNTLAIVAADSAGDERRVIAGNPVDSDLAVGGIKDHVCDRRKRTVAPFIELGVELLVEV